MNHHDSIKKSPMSTVWQRNKEMQKIIDEATERIKTNWDAFVAMILTSPFLNEFTLATSGAMIFVASMAWREFLQNMLDSALSIFKIESKLFTTFLNAIIFTCLAAFIVIMIHPSKEEDRPAK